MIRVWLSLLLPFWMNFLVGQVLYGRLLKENGEWLPGATILIRKADSTRIIAYTISDALGKFRFDIHERVDMLIEIRHLGYYSKTIRIDSLYHGSDSIIIIMKTKVETMKEVVIQSKPQVLIRNDTLVFNAEAFAGPDVRKVEDLLGKLQGFSLNPDGSLSFQGKPVEKLLIDGEDLAGKAYQLITKNLGADFIDKVEVINDYSANRLMRQIQKSGSVGVNLKIKKNFINKFSTNAEMAYSFEKRYHAESNSFRLAPKFKVFNFFNSNNTAQDVLGNAMGYYEMQGGKESQDLLNRNDNILSTAQISIPAVNDRYKNDNKDVSLAGMSAGTFGKFTKWRSLLLYSQRRLKTGAENEVQTFLDSGDVWKISNEMKLMTSGSLAFLKLAATRDNGHKSIAEFYLDAVFMHESEQFLNNAKDDITDSLLEKLSRKKLIVEASWKLTKEMRRKDLLIVEAGGRWITGVENLQSRTSRYASYFGLDDSYKQNFQELNSSKWSFHLSAANLKKFKNWKYSYGFEFRTGGSSMMGETLLSNQNDDTGYKKSRTTVASIASGFFKGTYKFGRRSDLNCSLSSGPQLLNRTGSSDLKVWFDFGMQYTLRFSGFRTFKLGIRSLTQSISPSVDIPAPIISGNAAILGSFLYSGQENQNSCLISYNVLQIQQQLNWSFSMSISSGPRKYQNSAFIEPEYSLNYMELTSGNFSGFLAFRMEKFVTEVKGKIGLSLAVSNSKNRFTLNMEQEQAKNISQQAETWWTSGFKKGPGFEARLRIGKWKSGKADTTNPGWGFGWSQKIQWKISKNFFTSLLWSSAQLGVREYFHGLDFFFQYKTNRNISIFLRGNNMLNARKIGEKMVQPYTVSYTNYSLLGRYLLAGINIQW